MILTTTRIVELKIMSYVEEEGGRLNNYAVEPKVYRAEPPSKAQQRNYIILGFFGMVLVVGSIAIAFLASNVK